MIRLLGIKETKIYDGNDTLNIVQHSLDTQINFDKEDKDTLIKDLHDKLETMFNYNIEVKPLYVSRDDTFFTFIVIPTNTTENNAVNKDLKK